jgi:DNA processing protein
MLRDELASWLRLTLTPGVGNLSARRLLEAFGLPADIFRQPASELRIHASGAQVAALQGVPAGLEALLDSTWTWLHGANPDGPQRAIATLGDPLYPTALLETADPPLLLYLTGPARFLKASTFPATRCLAMVGSRNPTPQGKENALQFSQALHSAGWTIVSGLALGIDTAAHEGALTTSAPDDDTPRTIAVVGTGLDRVYPKRNLELAHRIAEAGLIISEYPLGTPPLAANFPKRNRIISGLSLGTLVVEAAPASGSLITARLASEQGREVFAIPGSIHSIQSRGCHALLRQGAKLVETAQDILEELPHNSQPPLSRPDPLLSAVNEDPRHTGLLETMGYDPVGLDALQARTGLATPTLQVQLLELELEGTVVRLPGGLFQRMARA